MGGCLLFIARVSRGDSSRPLANGFLEIVPIMQNVSFFSREEVEAMRPISGVGLISICDPSAPRPHVDRFADRLELRFDDIDDSLDTGSYRSFSYWDAACVALFLLRKKRNSLVVHCEYGVSRSAAVALFASEIFCADLIRAHDAGGCNRLVYRRLHKIMQIFPFLCMVARLRRSCD